MVELFACCFGPVRPALDSPRQLDGVPDAVAPHAPVASPKKTEEELSEAPLASASSFSTPASASLPEELTQLLRGLPAAGARSNDVWTNLQKCVDALAGALPVACVSLYLFTTSRRHCKLVCNTSSPSCGAMRKGGWELTHAAEAPAALQVVGSGSAACFQAPSSGNRAPAVRKLSPELQLLHTQAGCTSFLCLPVYQGHNVVGALLLAHTGPIPSLAEHRWMSAFLPLLSLYLAETSALKLANFSEKLQSTSTLNQLAWTVTSELDGWFEWCHPDDTEVRLALLSPDQTTAMVLSRSVGPLRAYDPMNSIDVLVSGGMRSGGPGILPPQYMLQGSRRRSASVTSIGRAGDVDPPLQPHLPFRRDSTGCSVSARLSGAPLKQEEGLLGTHMSLANTLTRRCLAEGSKLLFVADVMAALKKYGEPWKDIFMESALVTNPTWVVAAPIVHAGRHLGAILWLSSCRLNPNMMAQAARASVPPLLHTVARQLQHLMMLQQLAPSSMPHGSVSSVTTGSASASGTLSEDTAALWAQVLALPHLVAVSGGGGMAADPRVGVHAAHASMGSSTDTMGPPLHAGLPDSAGDAQNNNSRTLRYTMMVRSDSASTNALMRAYQLAIYQHQRTSGPAPRDEFSSGYEEIQVLQKAGQGAFGSVYVAIWKGLVVAVKVMRQQAEGRRAMRTAWELAVTKSVSHPNIVMVHATFTDVVVVKQSKRIIRFVPAANTIAEPLAAPLGGGGGGGVGSPPPTNGGPLPPDAGLAPTAPPTANGCDVNPRCQVIIMEYCNLGPLHAYLAERRNALQKAGGIRDSHQQLLPPAAAAPNSGPYDPPAAAAAPAAPHLAQVEGRAGATSSGPAAAAVLGQHGLGMAEACNSGGANGSGGGGDGGSGGGGFFLGSSGTAHGHGQTAAGREPAAAAAAGPLGLGGGMPFAPPAAGHSASLTQLGPVGAGNSFSSDQLQQGVHGSGSFAGAAVVDMAVALATLLEVASAVQYLHGMGFIHCDLKPENILLRMASVPGDPRSFTAKVSDFGLSDLSTTDGPFMGELGGTVTHIAPEIVTQKRVTKAADVYAFGIVMWEMYTGMRPYADMFNSGSQRRMRDKLILAKVAHEGLRPVFPEATPYEYALLARRCWLADPALRPTFLEILGELEVLQRRYVHKPAALLLQPHSPSAAPNPLTAAAPPPPAPQLAPGSQPHSATAAGATAAGGAGAAGGSLWGGGGGSGTGSAAGRQLAYSAAAAAASGSHSGSGSGSGSATGRQLTGAATAVAALAAAVPVQYAAGVPMDVNSAAATFGSVTGSGSSGHRAVGTTGHVHVPPASPQLPAPRSQTDAGQYAASRLGFAPVVAGAQVPPVPLAQGQGEASPDRANGHQQQQQQHQQQRGVERLYSSAGQVRGGGGQVRATRPISYSQMVAAAGPSSPGGLADPALNPAAVPNAVGGAPAPAADSAGAAQHVDELGAQQAAKQGSHAMPVG